MTLSEHISTLNQRWVLANNIRTTLFSVWIQNQRCPNIKFWRFLFFSIRIFFHGHWQLTGQQEKGEDHLLLHSTTSTRSQAFIHLFATLQVRWLSYIFNRNACIYQTATQWDLPPYRITIWLTDDVILIFVCLLVDLIRFCYSYFTWETGGLEFASTIILVLQANQQNYIKSTLM